MKTILENLQVLPESIREKAIENIKKLSGEEVLSLKHVPFSETLHAAFIWFGSPEGHDYWSNIYRLYYENK